MKTYLEDYKEKHPRVKEIPYHCIKNFYPLVICRKDENCEKCWKSEKK